MNELLMKIIEESRIEDFYKINVDWLADKSMYMFIKNYLDKYNELPPKSVVESKFKCSCDAPFEYYWEEYENAGIVKEFSEIDFGQINQNIMLGKPKLALQELQKVLDRINNKTTNNTVVVKFSEIKSIFEEFLNKVKESGFEIVGIPTGWATLDRVTGGMKGGDLCLITGRVKTGKTTALLHLLKTVHLSGHSFMFVSMEMSLMEVAKRIYAMYSKMSSEVIRTGKLSNFGLQILKERMEEVVNLPDGMFVDGKFVLTIKDLKGLIATHRPEILLIDGGYLLKAMSYYSRRNSTWEIAKETADALKQLALSADIPVVASFQLTREVSKRNIDSIGLEHIHLTDALSANCSWAVGILDIEGEESKKMVKVLGTREGTPEDFIINWDWERMDFSEISRLEV